MQEIITYLQNHREYYLDQVKRLVAIPSVSSDPERKHEIVSCAKQLKSDMEDAGLEHVRLMETPGNPILYGDWLNADDDAPTILIYGHYDVQPEDPIELWESPPFEATRRDGRLYGRGVIDDKGQLYIHLAALGAWFNEQKKLPLNVKVIFEGEEEIGSKHLDDFLEEQQELLQADLVVVSDTGMFAKGVPSITYGLRGLAYFQIDVTGPGSDLHSGSYGGPVDNPANVLVRMLAQLKDDEGRVAIPGFYDDVADLSQSERENFARLPFNEAEFIESVGAPDIARDKDYSVLEQLWCRPTLDVNGLLSGFTGFGAKTVIPSTAMAKVSMRLVPHQDPEVIADLFEKYIVQIVPATVEVKVTRMHGGFYFLSDINEPMFEAARRAVQRAFGKETMLIREGGSIPFVHSITNILSSPAILLGFGLPDENAHAPNEWMDLDNFYLGMESIAYLYDEIARL